MRKITLTAGSGDCKDEAEDSDMNVNMLKTEADLGSTRLSNTSVASLLKS